MARRLARCGGLRAPLAECSRREAAARCALAGLRAEARTHRLHARLAPDSEASRGRVFGRGLRAWGGPRAPSTRAAARSALRTGQGAVGRLGCCFGPLGPGARLRPRAAAASGQVGHIDKPSQRVPESARPRPGRARSVARGTHDPLRRCGGQLWLRKGINTNFTTGVQLGRELRPLQVLAQVWQSPAVETVFRSVAGKPYASHEA